MKSIIKSKRGITLVALVITVIILLILAGITISQLTGSGLFENAKLAEQKSKEAQEKEDKTLEDYENKIGEYVTGNRNDNNSAVQPTGIKTDIYIKNEGTIMTSGYLEITSMEGLTRTTDEQNKISEYLSYSDEDGYTVLKSGWYFIDTYATVDSSSPADVMIRLNINEVEITLCEGWSTNSHDERSRNSFPFYLTQGDKMYFRAVGYKSATRRTVSANCYPMF